MRRAGNRLVLVLACTLVLMAQMSTTLYLPALPEVASELSISRHYAELSISLFVIGAALPVIYWGHAAEKYGRDRILDDGFKCVYWSEFISLFCTNNRELNGRESNPRDGSGWCCNHCQDLGKR